VPTLLSCMAKKVSQRNAVVLRRVGARIREIRRARGLSQERLALEAGLDRSYVGGVERGERNIAVINLDKIAKALDVPLSSLFGRT
jgi:transcriptional regulator with XRE-family HTH domain